MSETPNTHSQPDPPLDSTIARDAEEKKQFPSHSPEPWFLSHSGYANTPFVIFSGPRSPTWGTRHPLRGVNAIAEIFHDESPAHEEQRAIAELFVRAPRLLRTLYELFHGFLFLRGHVAFESESSVTVKNLAELQNRTGELLDELRKAGVL